jgi:hypothetical protein
MEKSPVYVDDNANGGLDTSPIESGDIHNRAQASEAKDIYGDIQTAEEYGYVTRGYVGGAFLLLSATIMTSKTALTCLQG